MRAKSTTLRGGGGGVEEKSGLFHRPDKDAHKKKKQLRQHKPQASHYQFAGLLDESQKLMLSIYQQPFEGSRSQTPTRLQRNAIGTGVNANLLQSLTPTVNDLNYQSLINKAREYEAAFRLGEKLNSRSRSRSKKRQNFKDGASSSITTQNKSFMKNSQSLALNNQANNFGTAQWGVTPMQNNQQLSFLKGQKKTPIHLNNNVKDTRKQLHPEDVLGGELLSPTFNRMLQDEQDNFASLLRHMEFKQELVNDVEEEEEWPLAQESAVFEIPSNLITKDDFIEKEQLLVGKDLHNKEYVQKSTTQPQQQSSIKDSIVQNTFLLHRDTMGSIQVANASPTIHEKNSQQFNGSKIKIASDSESLLQKRFSMEGQKNSHQNSKGIGPGNGSTLTIGSLTSNQNIQSRGSGLTGMQNLSSKLPVQLMKIQSLRSRASPSPIKYKKGSNRSKFNNKQFSIDPRFHRERIGTPETKARIETHDEFLTQEEINSSVDRETNIPAHLYSQTISVLVSPRQLGKNGDANEQMKIFDQSNLQSPLPIANADNQMLKKMQSRKIHDNQPLIDEKINNNMPVQTTYQKKQSIKGQTTKVVLPFSNQKQNFRNSNGGLIQGTTTTTLTSETTIPSVAAMQIDKQKSSFATADPVSKASKLTNNGSIITQEPNQVVGSILGLKKQKTNSSSGAVFYNKVSAGENTVTTFKHNRKSDGGTQQDTQFSTQEAFLTTQNGDDNKRKSNVASNTKENENTIKQMATLPLVQNNTNKLSFGGPQDNHFQEQQTIHDLQRSHTPFGGIGLGGARIRQSLIESWANDNQKALNRLSLNRLKKIQSGETWDSERDAIQSSYDYIDVDLNDAMAQAGNPMLTGRGRQFMKKIFKEDQWSEDESVYDRQMKMPDVKASPIQYQKEIGLKLRMADSTNVALFNGENSKQDNDSDELKEARGMLPETPFYKIVVKDRIQIINDYHDRCPLLELRKSIMKMRVYINRGAQLIMMHQLFESISISVIVVNSLFLAMDDPLRDSSETPQFMVIADDIFQYLYTIEMVVKIVSMGFFLNEGSYLRDAWNILDFVIIASGYMGMFLQGSGVNLSALRSFRVIRPLRTISSVAGLRVIVSSLINALPLLRDSLLVLLFFFLVFAIAGCQLFTGALKNRCFNEVTGVIDTTLTKFCGGGNSCRPGHYCAKSNENPANGATNFDNVAFALLQVFQIVSLEGWTAIMVALMQSVGTWIFVYFYPIIFIGAFFLLNLTLAVIKAKFTEEMNNKQENAGPPKPKKLDDAPQSSEDEDEKAFELNEQLRKIRRAKNMSPRSRENMAKKIRIDHLIWRLDNILKGRDAAHKVVERMDDNGQLTPTLSPLERSRIDEKPNSAGSVQNKSLLERSKILKATDKISIFKTHLSPDNLSSTKKYKSKNPFSPMYSHVFNNDITKPIIKATQKGGKSGNKISQKIQTNNQQERKNQPQITQGRLSKYNEEVQLRQQTSNQLQVPQDPWDKVNWSNLSPEETPKMGEGSMQITSFHVDKKVEMQNSPKFIGGGFQISKQSFNEPTSQQNNPLSVEQKKIVFAGINFHNPKNGRNSGSLGFGNVNTLQQYTSQSNAIKKNPLKLTIQLSGEQQTTVNNLNQDSSDLQASHTLHEFEEGFNRQDIYEKITQNFDIFEFIDKDDQPKQSQVKAPPPPQIQQQLKVTQELKRKRSRTIVIGKHDEEYRRNQQKILEGTDEDYDGSSFQVDEDLELDFNGDDDVEQQIKTQQIRESQAAQGSNALPRSSLPPRIKINQDDNSMTQGVVTPPDMNKDEDWSPRIDGIYGVEKKLTVHAHKRLIHKDLKLSLQKKNGSYSGTFSGIHDQHLSPFNKNAAKIKRQLNISPKLL